MIKVNPVQLPPAALAEYRERGYLITPKLLADDQLERLRVAVEIGRAHV